LEEEEEDIEDLKFCLLGAISVSGEVGTGSRNLGIVEILQKDDLMDSVPFEWRDSVVY
jgi:hypothetical protein